MTDGRFYVQPAAPLAGFQALTEGIGSRVEFERTRAEETRKQGLRQEAGRIMQTGTPEEIAQFGLENPWIREDIDAALGFVNEQTKQNAIESARKILIEGASPSQTLIDRAEFVIQQGGDATQSMQLAEQAQQDPQIAIDEAERVLALYDPKALEQYRELTAPGVTPDIKVGSQEILEDGTLIQSTPTGPVVYNPLGEKVTGQAAADAVKQARAEKVSNIRKASGEKKRASLEAEGELKAEVEAGVLSAKEAAKISTQAFDKLEKINIGVANIDEAIRLVDEGVETGAIMGRLPSIRANAVKLDNLQGRLGLDVIGQTTFGALSESELAFALSTALPTTLEGPELRQWLVEKKVAQEKLSDYVESAAIFLGTPGNTVADWMKKRRERRGAPLAEPGVEPTITGMSDEELIRIVGGGQ